jgi:hypothetical protein
MRPADHCPFVKPFPVDFDDCEAFQPVRFIPLSSDDRPLSPVRTCRNLLSRAVPGHPGRWYPACRLGDAAGRRAWVEAVEPRRLEAIGLLRAEMAEINAQFIEQLWLLKGEQLEVRRNHRESAALDRRMQDIGEGLIRQTAAFLQHRLQILADVDVTPEAIVFLLEQSIAQLIARSSGEVRWEIPEEWLARFPPQVRLFFRPPVSEVHSPATVD